MPTAQKDLEIRVVEVVVAKPNFIDHPKYVVWRINFSKRAIFIASRSEMALARQPVTLSNSRRRAVAAPTAVSIFEFAPRCAERNSDPSMLEVARSQTAFGSNKILVRRPAHGVIVMSSPRLSARSGSRPDRAR